METSKFQVGDRVKNKYAEWQGVHVITEINADGTFKYTLEHPYYVHPLLGKTTGGECYAPWVFRHVGENDE